MLLDYEIKYSDRKKLTITVERDSSVIVRAPNNMDPIKIREIVESKKSWLHEHLNHSQKYQELPHAPGKELVSGESMLYLGRNYRIGLVDGSSPDIHFNHQFVINKYSATPIKDLITTWYKDKAKDTVLPRVIRYATNLGVDFNKAEISEMRYRWGSCTPNNNLRFNWRLIKAPMFVIDYVVIHELAHLIEDNHTTRFWNIVKTHAVSYEKAKDWLRLNGHLLEQDIC